MFREIEVSTALPNNLYFKDKSLESEYIEYTIESSKPRIIFFTIFVILFSGFRVLFNFFLTPSFKIQFILSIIYFSLVLVFLVISQKMKSNSIKVILNLITFITGLAIEDYLIIMSMGSDLNSLNKLRFIYSFTVFCLITQILLVQYSQIAKILSTLNIVIILVFIYIFDRDIENIFYEIIYSVIFVWIIQVLDFEINKTSRILFLTKKNLDIRNNYTKSIFNGVPLMILTINNKNEISMNQKFITFLKSYFSQIKDLNEQNKSLNKITAIQDNVLKLNASATNGTKNKNFDETVKNQTSLINNNTLCNMIEFPNDIGNKIEGPSQNYEQFMMILNNFTLDEIKDLTLKKLLLNQNENDISKVKVTLDKIIKRINNSFENEVASTKEFTSIGYFYLNNILCFDNIHSKSEVQNNSEMQYFEIFYRKINENGEFYVELIIHNLTTLKKLEKENAESKYKHKILSKVAHEFKTPLISIITIIKELNLSQDNFEFNLNQINSLSYYLIFLVNDVVLYVNDSSVVDLVLEETSPELIIEFSYEILKIMLKYQNKSKIKTSLSLEPEIKNMKIRTDSNRVLQILLNLISNSIKFTKKGSIDLIAKKISNDQISIEVKDSGSGLSHDKIESLKKLKSDLNVKFNQEENVIGSGLGLRICQQISKSLQTSLEIHSSLGNGSSFSFKIKNLSIQNLDTYTSSSKVSQIQSRNFENPRTLKEDLNFLNENNDNYSQVLNIAKSKSKSKSSFLDSFMQNEGVQRIDRGFSTIRVSPIALKKKLRFKASESQQFPNEKSTIIYNKDITIQESLRKNLEKGFTFTEDNEEQNIKHNATVVQNEVKNLNINSILKGNNLKGNTKASIKGSDGNEGVFSNNRNITGSKMINVKKNSTSLLEISKLQSKNSGDSSNIFNFKHHIIVTDDNKSCRDLIEKQLKEIIPKKFSDRIGIIHCNDGVEFLNFVIQQHSIICCFLDENMEFMNGSEAVKILRKWESTKNVTIKFKIISVSAVNDNDQKQEIKNSGVDIILQKPTKKSELIEIFKQIKIDEYF